MTDKNGNGAATDPIASAMAGDPTLPDPRAKPDGYRQLPDLGRFHFDRFQRIVMNQFLSRTEMMSRLSDPFTNIYQACGLPDRNAPIPPEDLWSVYQRNPAADRAVWHKPNAVFQTPPLFYEEEDADVNTDWEMDVKSLSRRLRGEPSWFEGQEGEGDPLIGLFKRAYAMSRTGTYALIFLGLDDVPAGGEGEGLMTPSEFVAEPQVDAKGNLSTKVRGGAKKELMYARVFPEVQSRIASLENDPGNPRFGQPTSYELDFSAPTAGLPGPVLGAAVTLRRQVHWTRVVPIVPLREADEIRGKCPLRPYYTELLGLEKLYCSSPEMYRKGAFMGIGFKNQPGITQIDWDALKGMMERYQNDMQRWFAVLGLEPVPIAPQVVSPQAQIDVCIQAVCISEATPQRIFMGSERGEMSSAQDERSENDRVQGIRHSEVTPYVFVPFFDRLIRLGCLRPPKKTWKNWWPDIAAQTDGEKAAVALQESQAVTTWAGGGGRDMASDFDFWTKIARKSEDEAQEIIDNLEAHQEELLQQQIDAKVTEHTALVDAGVKKDPNAPPPMPPLPPGQVAQPQAPAGSTQQQPGTGTNQPQVPTKRGAGANQPQGQPQGGGR